MSSLGRDEQNKLNCEIVMEALENGGLARGNVTTARPVGATVDPEGRQITHWYCTELKDGEILQMVMHTWMAWVTSESAMAGVGNTVHIVGEI